MRTALNRLLRRIIAFVSGDPWLKCPVCKGGFAQSDSHDEGVDYQMGAGEWSYKLVCKNMDCRLEAAKHARGFYTLKLKVDQW